MDSNFFSLGTLETKGLVFVGGSGGLQIYDDNEVVMDDRRVGTMYALKQAHQDYTYPKAYAYATTVETEDTWHRRMGHLNSGDLHKLNKMVDGVTITQTKESTFCEPCVLAGQTRRISRKIMTRATKPFKGVFIDLCGGGTVLPVQRRCQILHAYYR